MDATVRCHNCQSPLRVPLSARGRRARCPSCGQPFVIPAADQLMEETFSSWINHDVDELFTRRYEENEQRLAPRRPVVLGQVPVVAGQPAGLQSYPSPQRRPPAADDPPEPLAAGALDLAQPAAADSPPLPEPPLASPPDEPGDVTPRPLADKPPVAPLAAKAHASAPEPSFGQSDSGASLSDFSQDLRAAEASPHLVVEEVDHAGVHFAFDSRWLGHEGFRASLPVCCAFSGDVKREHLIARPMIFLDRYPGSRDPGAAAALAKEYEQRVLADQHPRELLASVHRLVKMPAPYDAPVLYYLADRCAQMTLHCETTDRPDGVTCRVVIPDTGCARAWLRNVNGLCGEDYELLRRNTAIFHGPAWAALSETCRAKISAWCRLAAREEVRLYLSDSDFGRHDEGLAGLVVTDQRLVFRKHHHRGEVRRDDPGVSLAVYVRDHFADLRLRAAEGITRMVTIHRSDVETLVGELKREPAMRVEVRPG